MKPVLTLTLNPAVDVSTSTERVREEKKLRCSTVTREPGGGGVNVARVMARLGTPARCLVTTGGTTGEELRRLLTLEGIAHEAVPLTGLTRESVTVFERATGHQYRFVMAGPELSEAEWRRVLVETERMIEGAGMLVASGSLPPGVPDDFVARLVELCRPRGVRLVLDVSGPPLRRALEAGGVFLVKPNHRELRELAGRELAWPGQYEAFARELVERGAVEVVVVSHGHLGALIVAAGERFLLPALEVEVRSAVGAGDTYVGGLVTALARDEPLRSAARLGAAAAAATLLTPGTGLCRREDVERLLERTPEAIVRP